MIKRIRTAILSFFSFVSGGLGIAGFFGLCCTVVGGQILAFLGLSFLALTLSLYSKWFLIAAVIFLLLTIFSLKKSKS